MKGKIVAAIVALAVAVIALMVVVMPKIASKNTAINDEKTMGNVSSTENTNPTENENPAENISESMDIEHSVNPAGPNEGTMENVDPTEYIAEPVDLGLSVKWASFNVGASKSEEYGGLYGWGDATGTKTSTDNTDYPSENSPENICGTEYDIAHVKWGGTWRLPMKEEQDELVEKCDWKKGFYHEVKGYTVTGAPARWSWHRTGNQSRRCRTGRRTCPSILIMTLRHTAMCCSMWGRCLAFFRDKPCWEAGAKEVWE